MENEKKRISRFDDIKLDDTYFTNEGYLIDHPIVTSCGIFEYKNPDGSIRRELRLPEHVFSEKSLETYEGKPIIITHDAGRVNKDNVDNVNVGTMLSKGYQDGNDVRVKIVIHSIDDVKRSGLRKLSLGYDLILDETPGEWEGQPYDAIQTEIKVNHLAIVDKARAGEQARLNIDSKTKNMKGGNTMSESKANADALKKAIDDYKARQKRRLDEAETDPEKNTDSMLAGEGQETEPNSDEDVTDKVKIIKDKRDRRDQEGDPDSTEGAMGVIAQQDEDIDSLLEIIEQLQAKQDFASTSVNTSEENEDDDIGGGEDKSGGVKLVIKSDSADVDKIVRERLKLVRIGDKLNLDGVEDMSPLQIKKAVISKVNPNMRLDGKSNGYINAAFDVAVDQLNSVKTTEYQRKQASQRADSNSFKVSKTSAESAREKMIENLETRGGKK